MQEWYESLSELRGIATAADVQKLTEQYRLGYARLLDKALPADKGAAIYDVGCGPGLTLNILRSLGYAKLEGTDLSERAIQIARSLTLEVRPANSIRDLEAKADASYDCIFAVDVIEHLQKTDLMKLLEVVRLKLRPSGALILRFPNGDSPLVGRHLFNDISHVWTYTPVALTGLLAMAGFQKAKFLDEAIPFANGKRFLKVPVRHLGPCLIRLVIRASLGEHVDCLSPSVWAVARA